MSCDKILDFGMWVSGGYSYGESCLRDQFHLGPHCGNWIEANELDQKEYLLLDFAKFLGYRMPKEGIISYLEMRYKK